MTAPDLSTLPPDLPVPEDDGACDHLPGRRLPSLDLVSISGALVRLDRFPGRIVVFIYPGMGRPGVEPDGGLQAWNAIPGARGCTPHACSYRDLHEEFASLGVRVFGLSSQASDEQREAAERLHLPFELLSDAGFAFARLLRLPTFESAGRLYLRRATLVFVEGRIEHVFYPCFPPDRDAQRVLAWLSADR